MFSRLPPSAKAAIAPFCARPRTGVGVVISWLPSQLAYLLGRHAARSKHIYILTRCVRTHMLFVNMEKHHGARDSSHYSLYNHQKH